MTEQNTYDPQDVRQGRIVLRHNWSRAIFFAALAGIVIVTAIAGAFAFS